MIFVLLNLWLSKLPIPQRITFKIAFITFKTLYWIISLPIWANFLPPTVLLAHFDCPSRSLRSSDQHLLTVPFFKSSQTRRSFLLAAPTMWNSLPVALRTSSSITSFHSGFNTHLFRPWSLLSSIGNWIFGMAPCLSPLWVTVCGWRSLSLSCVLRAFLTLSLDGKTDVKLYYLLFIEIRLWRFKDSDF